MSRSLAVLAAFLAPIFAYAAISDLRSLIGKFTDILQALIPIMIGLGLLAFFWGIANFILNADNEEKRREGRQVMLWGVIALTVMVLIAGILTVIENTFFR